MITKQSISLLILSAFLVIPSGIAKAGDVDVQTGNMRTTISQDRDISVKDGRSQVNINRDRTSPNLRRRHGRIYNRIKNRTWRVSPQVRRSQICKGGSYSHQSSQSTVSSNGASRTRNSESTVCN